MKTYDLLVIGSGAGLNVATEVAAIGKKVAIIEKGPMGGTCLNRGCIPSKIVIHSADLADEIRRGQEFGISSQIKSINFKDVTDRANKMVDHDASSIKQGVSSSKNPTLYQGTAKFIDPFTVAIMGKQRTTIKGRKILLAAGARPFIPPIPGLAKVPFMTSTEALRQTKLPRSLIVIGGGYIGVELGHFYAALGCKVTILQRGPLLVPREDQDVATLVTEIWKKDKKYNLMLNVDTKKVSKTTKGITVTITQNGKLKNVSAEKLLVATGVKPNSDTLALEKTGVKMSKRGFVSVNKFMETNVKNIYALGDLAGVYMFRHSANLEADYATHNLTHKKQQAVDYFPMPHAVFTNPQIAGVGLTEQECQDKKIKYIIGRGAYKNTGMGAALAEKEGFVKFIVNPNTKKILGCHIIGPHASVLLHEVLIAMKTPNSLKLLRNVVHIHPALNEVVQRAAANIPI